MEKINKFKLKREIIKSVKDYGYLEHSTNPIEISTKHTLQVTIPLKEYWDLFNYVDLCIKNYAPLLKIVNKPYTKETWQTACIKRGHDTMRKIEITFQINLSENNYREYIKNKRIKNRFNRLNNLFCKGEKEKQDKKIKL